MWVMSLTIPYHETNLVGNLTKRYKISMVGYPISHEVKKNLVVVVMSGIFMGEKKNVTAFCKSLKKDRRTLRLEVEGNFGLTEMEQPVANQFLYKAGVIFVKPVMVNEKGEYLFELGSWDKQKLLEIISSCKIHSAKLNWIKNRKVTNIQVYGFSPNLTEKQKKCLRLAIENDYYGYPRKIDLKELAKLAGIAYSTFQFHLRVAEGKFFSSVKV
jgi:hypothetical protein